jgi:hypothetical protein
MAAATHFCCSQRSRESTTRVNLSRLRLNTIPALARLREKANEMKATKMHKATKKKKKTKKKTPNAVIFDIPRASLCMD